MANFNSFPVSYAPYFQQMPQQPQPTNNMVWVQGESGAKSYLVAPNVTLPLWDSERQTIYLKSADASGMPSMKVLDYTIRENANMPLQTPLNDNKAEYVTKDELEALKGELLTKINEVSGV